MEESQEGMGRLKEGLKHLEGEANKNYQQFRNQIDTYKEGAQEFLDATSAYVKENPQRSALIAGIAGVGFGVIVGLLLRGDRRY